jgi:hypothetical protein
VPFFDAGQTRFHAGIWDIIAGDLFHDEAIEGLVAVECFDHVIAIPPDKGLFSVPFVAVGVRAPHYVEPMPGPALPELGTGEQGVDNSFQFAIGCKCARIVTQVASVE